MHKFPQRGFLKGRKTKEERVSCCDFTSFINSQEGYPGLPLLDYKASLFYRRKRNAQRQKKLSTLKSGLFKTNLSISLFKHHHCCLRVDTAMEI